MKSVEQHLQHGTFRGDRHSDEKAVEPLVGTPVKPAWLKGEAAKLFKKKVDIYTKRNQSVVGLEDQLANYCSLQANVNSMQKSGMSVQPSMLAELRAWAVQFFDTSKSQQVSKNADNTGNKFNRNGKRGPAG